MPPIRRRGPRGGLVSTRLPLNAVNSVATNAANKRQLNEADSIDNALVSLERGLEKRPGFEMVPQYTIPSLTTWDWSSNNTRYDLFSLSNLPSSRDLFYYWYSINEDNTFLIVIDYDATGSTDKLFYVFQLLANGTWQEQTPAAQWDPTDSTIASGNSVVQAYATANSLSYANALKAGVVNLDSRKYITYQTAAKTAKESLRVVSLGSNLIILNNNVCAGFSSDTAGKLFDFTGVVPSTPVDDVEGRKVVYYTASTVMKVYDKGDDGLAGTSDDLLLGWKPSVLSGTVKGAVTSGSTTLTINPLTAVVPSSYLIGSSITINGTAYNISAFDPVTNIVTTNKSGGFAAITDATAYTITITGTTQIPVGDYFYYNASQQYLGQRVDDLSKIRLPPENFEWYALNGTGTDTTAQQMLASLYDTDHPYTGIVNGRGKVYFTLSPYLNSTAGYYRVISFPEGNSYTYTGSSSVTGFGRPYLQKVRTPDEHSYIDPRRMPQKLTVDITSSAVNKWSLNKVKWAPRTTGDKKTNPGPSVFKTSDGTKLRHIPIKALAVFNNRLWFAADDVVFSSRVGEYENLFLNDPSNIISTDPIDIRASSNQYAEISSMVPFDDYLFIDTKAKTQFQLMPASYSVLAPNNVTVAPVTFYSTAQITYPQLIGTRLYFFGPQRLYMYVGKNQLGYSSAIEISSAAAGYLPTNYRSICTAPAQDTIVMVSDDSPNEIYFNTSRFSADRVIQNSFYRYVLDTKYNIQTVQSFKNYLYTVAKLDASNTNDGTLLVLMRSKMIYEDPSVPRMDRMIKLKITTDNASYDASADITTLNVPRLGYDIDTTRFVVATPWTINGEDIGLTVIADVNANTESTFTATGLRFEIRGDYRPQTGQTNYLYIGSIFETKIQLSTLFVRDELNNIIDGVLNLRLGVFRHFNTGNYDIIVTQRGRTPLISRFNSPKMDFTYGEDAVPLEITEKQGEFVAKVFGYSDSTKISIVSDYTTPMNITNMEFKGKFKQKNSSFN